jgi:hypothetical protein
MSRTTISGTPSAVPDRPAKLERMSLRTTPVWFRTFGPFEPSPGNGPAVSFGIRLEGDTERSKAASSCEETENSAGRRAGDRMPVFR